MTDSPTWHGLEVDMLVEHVINAIWDMDDYYTQRKLRIDSVADLHDKVDLRDQIIQTVTWLRKPVPVDGDPAWEDFYCEVQAQVELHYIHDY